MMKYFSAALCAIFFLASFEAGAAELRVRPNRLNPNGKRARMKAEIRDVDVKSVETDSITMNGIAALKTRVTPKKVIAFFPKSEVVGTLGEVKRGDQVSIEVSFAVSGDAASTTLTDEVKIVGKKKNSP